MGLVGWCWGLYAGRGTGRREKGERGEGEGKVGGGGDVGWICGGEWELRRAGSLVGEWEGERDVPVSGIEIIGG